VSNGGIGTRAKKNQPGQVWGFVETKISIVGIGWRAGDQAGARRERCNSGSAKTKKGRHTFLYPGKHEGLETTDTDQGRKGGTGGRRGSSGGLLSVPMASAVALGEHHAITVADRTSQRLGGDRGD